MGTGFYVRRRFTAPVGGVVKGTAYLIGSLLVIARANADAAALFTAAVGGTWTLAKTSGQAWTEGQSLYWDNSNHRLDSDPTVGYECGVAAAVAANPSSTGSILLSGTPASTAEGQGLDTTELGLLNGATAGSVTASKVVTRDAASRIPQATASPAAAGNDQSNGAAITAQYNTVTGADGAKGVVLPVPAAGTVIVIVNTVATAGLKVYPGGASVAINSLTASTGAFTVGPGMTAVFVGRSATQWYCPDAAAAITNAMLASGAGVGAVLTAGLGGSRSVVKTDVATTTVVAAHGSKDRACLVVVVIDETYAAVGGVAPTLKVGEDDTIEKAFAAATIATKTAGTVLVAAFTNLATKKIIVTSTARTVDATGGATVIVLAIPTT